MEPAEYLRGTREKYVAYYRKLLHKLRNEGSECTPEVCIQPNPSPGDRRRPDPLCVDIVVKKDGKPSFNMVSASGEGIVGSLVLKIWIKDVPVKIYAGAWEGYPVWFRHPDPNWALLDGWKKKWLVFDRQAERDEDGLCGLVHYLGAPTVEAGGFVYCIDFGSAPVDALTDLLNALVDMGASEIEVGRSDGSDLPKEVLAELNQPRVTIERVAAILCRMISELPEVESVSQVNEMQLAVKSRENREQHTIFLENLHRILQRTGIEGRPTEVNRFLRGQREILGPKSAPDLSQLRLVVKDDRFLEEVRKLGPKMKPMVQQKLVADLWLICVWDAPNGMRFANEEDASKYELTPDQLFDYAKKNYLRERPAPEIGQQGQLWGAQTCDCYDATLLIDDQWWAQMASKIKGEMLACVPARNVVLIGDTARRNTLVELRRAAKKIEAGGDHLITDTILVRRDGKWEKFQELPNAPVPVPRHKKPWWRFW